MSKNFFSINDYTFYTTEDFQKGANPLMKEEDIHKV
jgi:hypothetical protein